MPPRRSERGRRAALTPPPPPPSPVRQASPFFKSRRESETFDIMVMKHLSEDATSFAIDEFPVMEEGAIERFWTEMVEERRAKRRSLFDSLLRQRAR